MNLRFPGSRLRMCCAAGLFLLSQDKEILNSEHREHAKSESGKHALVSTASAPGVRRYTLVGDGKIEWSQDLPFELTEARVCDTGTIAGWGICNSNFGPSASFMVIAIILKDGSFAQLELCGRSKSTTHGPWQPEVRSMFIWEDNNLCAYYIGKMLSPDIKALPSQLWVYELTSGVRKQVIEPSVAIAAELDLRASDVDVDTVYSDPAYSLVAVKCRLMGNIVGAPGSLKREAVKGILGVMTLGGKLLFARALDEGVYCEGISISGKGPLAFTLTADTFQPSGNRWAAVEVEGQLNGEEWTLSAR